MAKKTENEVKEPKKKQAEMDEAAKEKFQQKLKDLLALAKKKKNMLEYQEISDFFADMQLEAEQFDKILDFLEANNIDVLRITDDDSDDEILLDEMMKTRLKWKKSTFPCRMAYPLKIRSVCI